MRRRVFLLLVLLIALPLRAETAPPISAPLIPAHKGYDFDNPHILVQQRLFGLAHGITLLSASCAREPVYHDAVTQAYADWRVQQTSILQTLDSDLSRYHFGDRASEAGEQDIARALKLQSKLDLKPGSKALAAACNSFAEALQNTRYNLQQLFVLQSYASRLGVATTIATEAEVCRASLADEAKAALDSALHQWHENYDTGIDEARTALEKQWSDAQIDGTLEQWLAQARAKGRKMKRQTTLQGAKSCTTLAAWLLTQQANPDDEFNSKH